MQVRTFAAAVMLMLPSALLSQGTDLSLGVRFGTLGIGAEASKLLTGHIGVRASANFLSDNLTHTESDVDFAAHLKLHAVTGLIDLYPGNRGSFHLSGGIITNPVSITATGQPTGGTYKLNGNTYSAADVGTLTGSVDYPKVSPYAGLGFGTPAASHAALKFVFDLGVAIGKPTVLLSSNSSDPSLQNDLAAQQVTTQHDIDKFAKVYPVISTGLVFRF